MEHSKLTYHLSYTRWGSHIDALQPLMYHIEEMYEACEETRISYSRRNTSAEIK